MNVSKLNDLQNSLARTSNCRCNSVFIYFVRFMKKKRKEEFISKESLTTTAIMIFNIVLDIDSLYMTWCCCVALESIFFLFMFFFSSHNSCSFFLVLFSFSLRSVYAITKKGLNFMCLTNVFFSFVLTHWRKMCVGTRAL